ncbi:MAG TPA: hypothetical protein VLN49_12840 [Gemmatimonadaceae bacterium]|nr:hypothetical protein [Gemmatimonadaceae bacterium]
MALRELTATEQPTAGPTVVHRPTVVPSSASAGLATPATGSITLAAEHFAAATLYLLAGAVGLVWIAPQLAAGMFLEPHVAGVTHLFTLGWLTTTIFGALCQLLPVALGAPVRWPRVAHASFWTFATGAGLFACGVAANAMMLHHGGIALITTGITLAAVNIVSSLRRARSRDATWAAIVLALSFLVSTLGLGLVLLHNLHTGFIAAARVQVLATHLHVAIVGWALVMIVGVSHRLLPMFLLAHGVDTRWTKRSLLLLSTGVPVLAVGLNVPASHLTWPGALLLAGGLWCFARQAYGFYRARIRKRIDVGMRFAGTAISFLLLASVLGLALLVRGPTSTRVATAYVLLGLLGGIVMYVVGFFYKIVPLLAWTVKYRGRMGKSGVPTVADMFSARVAILQLGAMATGVALLTVSILAASTLGARVGALLFLSGVLLFISQLVRIAFGGRLEAANG